MRFVFSLICLLLLAGCVALQVHSTIETHHRLGPADLEKRLAVFPAREDQANTIQFEEYSRLIEDGMRRVGFWVVPRDRPAELVAFFGYGVDEGRDELYSYAIPQFVRLVSSQAKHTGL